jgi:hypothetical protein
MTPSGQKSTDGTNKSVRYHPLFECDVLESADWYDQRLPGLGNLFVVDPARVATQRIIEQPSLFAPTEHGLRYVRLKRFPYVVLFDVTETEILMLGVLHTARSIEKWRERRRG